MQVCDQQQKNKMQITTEPIKTETYGKPNQQQRFSDQSVDFNIKSTTLDSSTQPTSYPDASSLQNQNIYNTYLSRLNENSEFSKSLLAQQSNHYMVSSKGNTKDQSKTVKQELAAPPQPQLKQSLSETERARIRERYSEKAKERRLRMYEKAILLAEEREREEGKRYRSQKQLHFRITYETYFGQNIFVVGSVSQLGSWDYEKAIPLTWCPGNLWTGAITLSVEDGIVEYKYIAKDGNTGHVLWEPGYNHKIDTAKLSATTTLDNSWGNAV